MTHALAASVHETPPSYRIPSSEVWETVAKVARRDPVSGRTQKVRVVIVRWKNDRGGVSEHRFYDAVDAERFAQAKRRRPVFRRARRQRRRLDSGRSRENS